MEKERGRGMQKDEVLIENRTAGDLDIIPQENGCGNWINMDYGREGLGIDVRYRDYLPLKSR